MLGFLGQYWHGIRTRLTGLERSYLHRPCSADGMKSGFSSLQSKQFSVTTVDG